MKLAAVSFLLPALVLVASAQESTAVFDAPTVKFANDVTVTEMADVDGDGRRDAVGWWPSTTVPNTIDVTAFPTRPDGSFDAGLTAQVASGTLAQPPQIWTMERGRFDADGREDVVCSFWDQVSVLVSQPAGPPTVFAAWLEPSHVRTIAVVDFDTDGLDDVVVGVLGVGLRSYRNTGTGFQLVATKAIGGDLKTLDVDGDPALELAALNGPNLVLVDPTGGALAVKGTFTLPYSTLDLPHLVAGDVDGDGDDDLVVFAEAVERYVVIRRTGPTTFAPEAEAVGGPATDLADVDGDGDLDGVCCSGSGPAPTTDSTSTFRVTKNDGSGAFDEAVDIQGVGGFRLAGAEDIDGDGDVDLVAGRCVVYNRDTFALDPQPRLEGVWNDPLLRAADLDGDGDPDPSFGAATVWRNDGTGASAPFALALPDPPNGGTWKSPGFLGDFDGDADVDAILGLAVGTQVQGLRLLRNSGGGAFVDAGFALTPGLADWHWSETATGDFDEDGDLDLALSDGSGNPLTTTLRNQGDGTFVLGPTFLGGMPRAAVDVDGDQHLDIVGSIHGGAVVVAFGAGDGTFGATVALNTRVEYYDRIAVADLDQNGYQDVAAVNHTVVGGELHLWLNQSGRSFTKSTIPMNGGQESTDRARVLADDVDGDGDVDLVTTERDLGASVARIFLGDGSGAFPDQVHQVLDVNLLADVDGDGDRDLVGRRISRNSRSRFPADGLRRQFGHATPGLGGLAPTLGATGPFRVGSEVGVRLVGGRGASLAVLMLGGAPGLATDWPAPGLEAYVAPPLWVGTIALGGGSATPGTGAAIFPPLAVPPAAAGAHVTMQAFVFDPDATSWLAQTNGLELRID